MYSTISNLGKSVNYHTDQADPLTYCLSPNYNSEWMHGSTVSNLLNTPQSEPCQLYMSERCAQKWDDACNVYYDKNQDTFWPNLGAIDLQSQKRANNFLQYSPTTGENMIRNAVEKRFFVYPNAASEKVPFDPNMASSPLFTRINVDSLTPAWVLHPMAVGTLHDNDHYTNLMLQNSKPCFDLIARFHKIFKQQPVLLTKISGSNPNSKLLSFFQQNDNILSYYNNLP